MNEINIEVWLESMIEKAEAELSKLTSKEKIALASGFDNRGLDCITERWYLPDSMRGTSAVAQLANIVKAVDDMLYTFYNENEDLIEEGA